MREEVGSAGFLPAEQIRTRPDLALPARDLRVGELGELHAPLHGAAGLLLLLLVVLPEVPSVARVLAVRGQGRAMGRSMPR